MAFLATGRILTKSVVSSHVRPALINFTRSVIVSIVNVTWLSAISTSLDLGRRAAVSPQNHFIHENCFSAID